ncbi:MAG: tRNA pseudouridine(38-40) synthase TruA [Anaerolineae bacterium]|nr:tRNA pseudouridine(38-40) synthase TruA [Anaerolineae bacterium]
MARYQVIIAYDGTDFCGFQRQGKSRTVQAEFEKALRCIGWQGKTIYAAGRTDAGVHATGQVIAFDLDWQHGVDALGKAINANLPPDAAVVSVRVAADDFHPRFAACGRTYLYTIYCQPQRNPLLERYAWRVDPPVALELLEEASALLVGKHDFSAFGSPPRKGGSTVREVFHAAWGSVSQQENSLQFVVCANAFLYHMVRRMVFLQVLVGQRRLEMEALAAGISEGRQLLPGIAPPQGLVLSKVIYDERVV